MMKGIMCLTRAVRRQCEGWELGVHVWDGTWEVGVCVREGWEVGVRMRQGLEVGVRVWDRKDGGRGIRLRKGSEESM